jgi:hypothetical protein
MMVQKPRRNSDRDAMPAKAALPWRMPEDAALPSPPGTRAKWLLALAIILQIGWLVALAAMALFAK